MQHRNNFDFLRLVFASLVIVTHAVLLSGYGDQDFLGRWTGGQINCSYLGVRGFFVISGFLVFKSLRRSDTAWQYGKKRLLRIFPGLLVMLLVVTFLAGPLLSSFSLKNYYTHSGTWQYFFSSLRIPCIPNTETLPGVFTNNPYEPAVNGSLWTIWFELVFYAGLLILFPWRHKQYIMQWMLPLIWLTLYALFLLGQAWKDAFIIPFTHISAEVGVDLALYFLAGSLLTLLPWKESRSLRICLLVAGLIIGAAGLGLHLFHWLRYLALPLMVLSIGNGHVPALARLRKLGEPSYGIYIYAFPVEQAIVQIMHPGPVVVILIALPVSFVLGYASWHAIESRFLSLKMKPAGK